MLLLLVARCFFHIAIYQLNFFSIPGLTSAVPGLMVVLKEKLVVVM